MHLYFYFIGGETAQILYGMVFENCNKTPEQFFPIVIYY